MMADQTVSLSPEMLQQIITTAITAATTAMNQNRPSANQTAEKPKRPKISSGTILEKGSYFLNKRERYIVLTRINGEGCSNHLIDCYNEDLQLSLHRTRLSSLNKKSEEFVL